MDTTRREAIVPGLLTLVGVWSALSLACAPCSEYCDQFQASMAGLTDPYADLRPGVEADHLRISISPEALSRLATGAGAGIERQLAALVPSQFQVPLVGWQVASHVSVRTTDFELTSHPRGVGVTIGLATDIALQLPAEIGGASGGLSGEVRLRTVIDVADGEAPTLTLRIGDSALDHLRLTPIGLAGLGPFVHDVTRMMESAVREALSPSVLRQLGDISLLTLEPQTIEGATVRMMVNRLDVDPPTGRLEVGLVTDLVSDGPVVAAPRPRADSGDVVVTLSPDLGAALLGSVLAVDGGRRFGSDGGDGGPYGVTVSTLRPRRGGVAFDYRLYRFSRPCLVADFSGEADLSWQDGGPMATVNRHELTYASRFESAVEDASPPVEALSRRLTALLGRALATRTITIPPELRASLEPVRLRVSRRGYVVGWALSVEVPAG